MRPSFVLPLALSLLAPVAAQNEAQPPTQDPIQHPNVLLIFIDDMGYIDIGSDGAPFHLTPNLDAFAAAQGSIRFSNFQSSHPVCSPTRASLMTGRYPHRVGIDNWIGGPSHFEENWPERLPEEEITIAEVFQEAGYATGYIGKWHLGNRQGEGRPTDHGFQWDFATNDAGHPASYYPPYDGGNPDSPHAIPDLEGHEGYLTDQLCAHASEFIEAQAKEDQPWFLTLATYAVHTPIQPPRDTLPAVQERAREMFPDGPQPGIPEPHSPNSYSRAHQDNPAYAAMVERLDRELGKVFQSLSRSGQIDNTIIIFTADNGSLSTDRDAQGGPAYSFPDRAGKAYMFQGGTHVPSIIHLPANSIPARVSDQFAATTDLMPTLLQLCAIAPPKGVEFDGLSLASLIRGETENLADRDFLWSYPYNHPNGHRAAQSLFHENQDGAWKLVHFLGDDSLQLYQLDEDPSEEDDVASQFPELTAELAKRLQSEYERTRYPN